MPDEALEYTANWSANTYMVQFSDDGLADITVTFGGAYGDLPELSREGHTFDGWYYRNVWRRKNRKRQYCSYCKQKHLQDIAESKYAEDSDSKQ